MRAATYSNGLPAAITSQMNGFNQHAASLIQSKNLLFNNFNTMQLQNQLRHQQLIQQQLLKLQLQQNQPNANCYQMVSPASSPKAMEISQPSMSPAESTSQPMDQHTPMHSPLNTSSSSSMELPIVSVQCSSVNTSCENSLIISPVSTPNCSPVNCMSPPVTNSSPLSVQSIHQPISALLPSAEHYQTINQLFHQNHENRPNKLNLMLPDGQLQKKCNKRKPNAKTKSTLKLENKFDLSQLKNEKLNKKAKQRTAANERERKRMSNINQAFNRLRGVILCDAKEPERVEKLSKMEILKLAQRYIAHLTSKLQE